MAAGGSTPEASTVKRNLSFFLATNKLASTYSNEVGLLGFVLDLLTLLAEDALLRSRYLKYSRLKLEYLRRTAVPDSSLRLVGLFGHLLLVDLHIGLGVKCRYRRWAPFRVHLADSFLHVKLYVDFLVL